MTEEKRVAARRRVFKGGQITFTGRGAAIDCFIRNISDTGARLTVESAVGIPDTFDLMFDQGLIRKCEVVWRQATEIGVRFVQTVCTDLASKI